MRNLSNFVTPCIYVLLCACTPDSNNIGETLTTSGETDASTSETDGATEDPTDGLSDATSDAPGTTAAESTGAVDTTTDATTSQTSADDTTLDDLTTGDASGSETTAETGTGDTTGDTGGDGFACGELTCDAATQYCSVFVPGVMGAEIMYSCAQIPAQCDDTPSCACLPDGEAPPCQCAEDQGFTVTCYGA